MFADHHLVLIEIGLEAPRNRIQLVGNRFIAQVNTSAQAMLKFAETAVDGLESLVDGVESLVDFGEAPIHSLFEVRDGHTLRRVANHSIVTVRRRCRLSSCGIARDSKAQPPHNRSNCNADSLADRRFYGAGAMVVAAFHRTTTDAVAVLSLLTKPAIGACEYRQRYPSLSARRLFSAACAVASASARYAVESLKSG